jgi:hypothetical protein
MSHLTYYNYEGFGQEAHQNYSYSQAVRVGDRIECSGQGRSILKYLSQKVADEQIYRRVGS